jgi:hypothetical protein
MDLDQAKKYLGVGTATISAVITVGAVALAYLDSKFVSVEKYEQRTLSTESLLKQLRIDAAIQVLENRKMILEERLLIIKTCESIPTCEMKGSTAASREKTQRELEDVFAAQREWRKQKSTPN